MISLKRISLIFLGLNAVLSILTLLFHQGDIFIHWNAQHVPDQRSPVFMAVVVPIIAGVIYFLFIKLSPAKIHEDDSTIQLFQYRIPVPVTKNNIQSIENAIKQFIDSILLILQSVFLWVSLVFLLQKDLFSRMGIVFVLLIIVDLVFFIYKLYKTA